MKQITYRWVLALCAALFLTAAIEGVFLYMLKQKNTILLQWTAVAIVALEEERQAIAICKRAREYCERAQCL